MLSGNQVAVRELRASSTTAERLSVCHIASGDLWAGAEKQVAILIRGLVRRGVSVCAVFLNEGELASEARNAGAIVQVIPERSNSFTSIARQAASFIRTQECAVIHSHRYKENLIAATVARNSGVRILVRTQHGRPEPLHGLSRLRAVGIRTIEDVSARLMHAHYIAVSRDLRSYLEARAGRDLVHVISNGLDLSETVPSDDRQRLRDSLALSADDIAIGIVGRIVPVKRIDIFLRAAACARLSEHVKFFVIGEGPLSRQMQLLAESLGLRDRVRFLGYSRKVLDWISALDILSMCSDHEGLPMTLLEAMALGVPVVARKVGGIGEVVQDTQTGFLVDDDTPESLAEKWKTALALSAGSRQRMIAAARRRIESSYSSEMTADRTLDLYRELLR